MCGELLPLLSSRRLLLRLLLLCRHLRPILVRHAVCLNGISLPIVNRVPLPIHRVLAENVANGDPRLSPDVKHIGLALDVIGHDLFQTSKLRGLLVGALPLQLARFETTLPNRAGKSRGRNAPKRRVFEQERRDFDRDLIEIIVDLRRERCQKLVESLRGFARIDRAIRIENHVDENLILHCLFRFFSHTITLGREATIASFPGLTRESGIALPRLCCVPASLTAPPSHTLYYRDSVGRVKASEDLFSFPRHLANPRKPSTKRHLKV